MGTYLNFTGAVNITNCSSCPTGTYQTGTGMAQLAMCTLCGTGTFQNGTGKSTIGACTRCPAGYYQARLGAISLANCTLCEPGKFADGTANLAACLPCETGSYQTGSGSTVCTQCGYPRTTVSEGSISKEACNCEVGKEAVGEDCAFCRIGYFKDNAEPGRPCYKCSEAIGPFSTTLSNGSILVQDCLCEVGFTGPDGGISETSNLAGLLQPCAPCAFGTYKDAVVSEGVTSQYSTVCKAAPVASAAQVLSCVPLLPGSRVRAPNVTASAPAT